MKTLDQVRKGQWFKICLIPDEQIAKQAIRIGISQRSVLYCLAKLPAGPVVFQLGNQEIAVGRKLATRIEVSSLWSEHGTGYQGWESSEGKFDQQFFLRKG